MNIDTIKKVNDFKKAHLNLAQWALNKNCNISVFVDGDIELKKSNNYEKIKEYLECADEVEIIIYSEHDIYKAWALIIPFNDDEESVCDYSANSFMNDWELQFDNLYQELNKVA